MQKRQVSHCGVIFWKKRVWHDATFHQWVLNIQILFYSDKKLHALHIANDSKQAFWYHVHYIQRDPFLSPLRLINSKPLFLKRLVIQRYIRWIGTYCTQFALWQATRLNSHNRPLVKTHGVFLHLYTRLSFHAKSRWCTKSDIFFVYNKWATLWKPGPSSVVECFSLFPFLYNPTMV